MEENQKCGTVFDIQHFSVSDGPGIRTTVFLKGCPLRCEWCHNPESYITDTQMMYYEERCGSCGACAEICPNGCHRMADGNHLFDREQCVMCGKCTGKCPSGALKTVGQKRTTEDVLKEVLEDRFFYESSGGGMTLSGGEPMFQPDFALNLSKAAKECGLHVCVETSGFCKKEHLERMLPFVDLFLYDYKMTGEENHKKYTGVSQKVISENLCFLDRLGADIILRCPIIPGININKEHITGIVTIAGKLTHLQEIHLEPYHNIGIPKRSGLGINENMQMLTPPAREELLSVAEEIQARTGVKTVVM